MGYMTFYNLTWTDPSLSAREALHQEGVHTENDEEIRHWLERDPATASELEDICAYSACCWSKWAGHDQDMIRLSLNFPQVLFVLCGAGEEDDDLWRSYYLGGKLQHAPAEIRYPPFDPEKLVEPADLGLA